MKQKQSKITQDQKKQMIIYGLVIVLVLAILLLNSLILGPSDGSLVSALMAVITSFSLLAGISVIIIGLYLLPYLIANHRKHRNGKSILMLNIFLGWTFIGWVISLVWAFTDNTKS